MFTSTLLILFALEGPRAFAKGRTQLLLQIKPPTAALFIDDHSKGNASAGRIIDVSPGFHVIRLVLGKDEHEERIKFAAGKQTTYSYEFDEASPAAPADGDQPSPEPEASP